MDRKRVAACWLLCVLTAMTAMAQTQVNLVINPQLNEDIGLRAGAEVAIPLGDKWSLNPGLQWSLRNRGASASKTVNDHHTDAHCRDVAHFITLPLRVGARLGDTSNQRLSFSLLFGPYIAYGLGGTSRATQTTIQTDIIKTKTHTGAFGADGRYKSRLDYGISMELRGTIRQHYLVGVFTEVGLRDLYRSNGILEEVVQDIFGIGKQNLALGLTLGYRL